MYKYTRYYVVVARVFTSPEDYDDKMFVRPSLRRKYTKGWISEVKETSTNDDDDNNNKVIGRCRKTSPSIIIVVGS